MPRTHYAFSHSLLTHLYFEHYNYLLEQFYIGKENFEFYLKYLWDSIKYNKELSKSLEDAVDSTIPEFNVFAEKIDDESFILFIQLSDVKVPSEALCIAMKLEKENTNPKYYTYELGLSEINNKPIFFTCEWTKERKHVNFGSMEEYDVHEFINKVKTL